MEMGSKSSMGGRLRTNRRSPRHRHAVEECSCQSALILDLAHQSCAPCQIGAPKLTPSELEAALPELPGWSVVDNHHLSRTLRFQDFQSALDWVNTAGRICEEEGHHAEFSLGWGRADAKIYTHKVDGLTQADLVLAAKFVGITPPQR